MSYLRSMLMPRIGIVLNWRNQPNKSDLYSIHLRIKIGGAARYYKIDTPQKYHPHNGLVMMITGLKTPIHSLLK